MKLKAAQLLAPYDPGQGTAPPGSGGITLVVQWIAWGALILAVVSLIAIGAMAMMARRSGRSDNLPENIGSWVLGLVLVGTASGITGAVLAAAGG